MGLGDNKGGTMYDITKRPLKTDLQELRDFFFLYLSLVAKDGSWGISIEEVLV